MYGERSREAVRFKECSDVYYKIYIIILYLCISYRRRTRRLAKSSGCTDGHGSNANPLYMTTCIYVLDTYIIIITIYDIYNVSYYIRRYNILIYTCI